MALIRDYSDSEIVNLLSDKAEILFARLLTKLDCNGIYIADPVLLNAYIFPRKGYRIAQITDWLIELETIHKKVSGRNCPPLMRRYRHAATGKEYLIIGNFGQKFKFKKGVYPPPDLPPEEEIEIESEVEEEIEVEELPREDEFLIYCQNYLSVIGKNYGQYETALKAKFFAWKENHWKDGHNKKIKNWKSKIQNTIPFLKPDNSISSKNNASAAMDMLARQEEEIKRMHGS